MGERKERGREKIRERKERVREKMGRRRKEEEKIWERGIIGEKKIDGREKGKR
jgi:hypothetical protein